MRTDDLSSDEISRIVYSALEEDIGVGDATTNSTVPGDAMAEASMLARERLVLAGVRLAEEAFKQLSAAVEVRLDAHDGDRLEPGAGILVVRGPARAVLTAERVALNFVQRLSGIATLTAQYVDAVKGCGARILDTRKTTPGWRRLEKYAVRCGGGKNHRFGLFDMVMIKDNHLAVLEGARSNPIAEAVNGARRLNPKLKIEVEADTIEQVHQAVDAGADFILLDNMSVEELRAAVKIINERAFSEASGGINLETVRSIAECGVDFISVGALTHSARAVDIGLDFKCSKYKS
ncbi:MAG: carboxylating nicotinate-nucleotide diphosphorylase [Verrucomicrobia bacterium]|nr:carboxylating nicotinate-nucleotide diphosphorylase [Verrucomicrobiota bacterium]